MKHFSLRFKITFWFTAALLAVVLLTYWILLSVSSQILQKSIRDSLIQTVNGNLDDVRFYATPDDADLNKDASRFFPFRDGLLEVEQDFLHQSNEVYTAIYSADASLVYGENPISTDTMSLKFVESTVQTVKSDGVTYYVFDRKLSARGMEGLWVRGVVSETHGTSQMSAITRISLILLPVLALGAFAGGYLLVRRMLRPIQKISDTASRIGDGDDLKQRIDLGPGDDELHQLADTFNDMFDKLDHSFEAQRRFISDASHELRTPVSVITAQCELTLENAADPSEYEQALRVVQRQSRKLSRLVNEMLDFTRLEGGASRYVREPVDLSELVSSLCADLALIREHEIALAYDVEPDIVLTGNRDLLARLLTNLVSNAYRYGREGGHIWVRLTRESDGVHLSVADDGIGISPEDQENIFQRFYQADPSHSGAGIGLGLSMASEIARFHGGKITVKSELGRGSTFEAVLTEASGG